MMQMKVPIQPNTIETDGGNPFKDDLLDRKSLADAMKNLVPKIEGSAVIAVDGAWGSGKTTFLQMWSQQLRNNGFPMIIFNAWETDFSNDPIIALSSELLSGLQEYASDSKIEVLKEQSRVLTKNVIKSGTLSLLKTATAGLVNIDPELIKELRRVEALFDIDRVSQYIASKESITEFKCVLKQTVDELSNLGGTAPLVVVIDELDRCRPTYAIELLEAAKHIFSVQGIVFVLGVNTSELANSISALYGSKFNGRAYLRRFFNIDVPLPEVTRAQIIESTLHSLGVDSKTQLMPPSTPGYLHTSMLEMFKHFFDMIGLDYRTLDQELRRLVLAYHALGSKTEWLRVYYVVLQILRVLDRDLFGTFRSLEKTDEQVVQDVFSRPGGAELIASDTGCLFVAVIVVAAWDIAGRPTDVKHYSRICGRLHSRLREESLPISMDEKLTKTYKLLDRLDPAKSFNTLSILKDLIEKQELFIHAVFDLIERFEQSSNRLEKDE